MKTKNLVWNLQRGSSAAGQRASVFISYPRVDAVAVRRLAETLVDAGLDVWLDTDEIIPGEDFTHRIEAGMAACRAFVAWYSRNYRTSSYCMHEFTTAWIKAQSLPGTALDRILIINPEVTVDHIEAGDFDRQEHFRATRDGALEARALERIGVRVDSLVGVFGDAIVLPAPKLCPAKRSRYDHFRGRRRELWRIHSVFNAVPDDHTPRVLQIVGLGGSGKSLLAVEYANVFGSAYPGGIFWLSAQGIAEGRSISPKEREDRRELQLKAIAENWQYPPWNPTSKVPIERHIEQHLASAQPYLWIVDDLPPDLDQAHDEFKNKWQAPSQAGRTLVTTRTGRYGASIGRVMHIDKLDPDAALALLTNGSPPRRKRELEAVRRLLEKLVYHPLAVDVAGRLLENNAWTFAEFSKRLADESRDPLLGATAEALEDSLPSDYHKSIVRTILIGLRVLDARALDLLRFACVLGSDVPVPRSLAEALMGRLWGPRDSDPEAKFTRAVNQLRNQALAHEHSAGAQVKRLEVHGLVLYTLLHADPAGESGRELRAKLGCELQALLLDENWYRTKSKELPPRVFRYDYLVLSKVMTGSINEIAQVLSDCSTLPPRSRVELMQLLGRAHEELGELLFAEKILARSVEICREHALTDLQAEAFTQLGIVQFHKGGFQESHRTLEKALALFEDLGNAGQTEGYVTCLDWFGEYHRELEDWPEALEYHERAMRIAEELIQASRSADELSESRRVELDNLLAHALANIGAVHYWRRDYKKALDCWEECLRICEGNKDRWNAHYLIDVGYMTFLVVRDMEGRSLSKGYLEEGVELADEMGFKEECARGMMNAASVYFIDNELDRAEKLYNKAHTLAQEQGIEKLIWRIQHNLGNLFARKKQRRLARKYYEDAAATVRKSIREGYDSPKKRMKAMTHRLNVYRNLILVYLNEHDSEAADEVGALDSRLGEYLQNRRRRECLEQEELRSKNHNFFILGGEPYYIETE